MSAQKHTPAPWEVSSAGHGSLSCFVIDEYFVLNRTVADNRAIAADIIDPATGMPSEANARLIAAAPELLAELELLSSVVEGCGMAAMPEVECRLVFARSAIAKATGGAA